MANAKCDSRVGAGVDKIMGIEGGSSAWASAPRHCGVHTVCGECVEVQGCEVDEE